MAYKDKERERAYQRAYRAANREKGRTYGKAYYLANREEKWLTVKMIEKKLAYQKANPEKARKAVKTYGRNYPEKKRAHWALKHAIRVGRVVRPSACSRCGNEGLTHAHHNDYDKPLEVEFLCSSCHGKQHRMDQST